MGHAYLLQSDQLLCNLVDCSLPGSSPHSTLQARILELDCHALFQGIFDSDQTDISYLCAFAGGFFTTSSTWEFNPEYSLEGPMLKLKLQYYAHLMQRADSLEKTLMLDKIEGERRRG